MPHPYGPNAGQPASTDNTAYTSNGPNTSAKQTCATGGSMSATVSGTASHTAGQGAAVLFDAPAAMTIAGVRLWRHEAVGQSSGGSPFTKATYGSTLVEPDCSSGLGCRGRGDPSAPLSAANEVAVSNLREITQVRWNAFCGGAAGATCGPNPGGAPSAVYNVFAADMLLDDPVAPAVGSAGGPLLAGGTLTGAQSASLTATDAASGVQKGVLVVDGAIAGEQTLDTSGGGGCADLGVAPDRRPSYADTQPCPASVSGLVTLNTDALTPGRHSLSVLVADAAGNTTLAHSGAITVVGSVPVGSPNGAPASRGAKLTARFGTRGRRVRRLGYETRPTISGRLVSEAGAPIAGAAVDILVRDARSGAPTARVATATTGADGRLRVKLPRGPSRTITLRYTAFKGDPKPAAAIRLRAVVGARLTASSSQRSVRVGARLRISGRLRYLRRAGVAITIQVRESGGWRTFDTVKTRKDGRYRWTHRFRSRSLVGRTVAIRARADSPIYPFAPGTSRVVRVRFR